MNLRTPRRRISPQTRRRYKAIKGFFKRALGSVSQPDLLQITSSIAVNVTDINHKIIGLEQHLSEVCKQCRDHHQESRSEQSGSPAPPELRDDASQRALQEPDQLTSKQTHVIYTKSEDQCKKSLETEYTRSINNESNKETSGHTMNAVYEDDHNQILKKNKSKVDSRANDHVIKQNYQKHKTESTHKTFVSSYSTSSFHSLDNYRDMYHSVPGYSGNCEQRRNRTHVLNNHHSNKTYREPNTERYEHIEHREERPQKFTRNKKSKHHSTELDPDFIADIIKRQYKPVKFGRRHSDLSQFSTPVCRDHDFCHNADYLIPEEHEPCNCGKRHHNRHTYYNECSDARSVCDARLYNVKRNTRTKHRRKQSDVNADSEIYDLVPVKEKSSPKSRRKFLEDNMRSAYYKEVPPSPRSLRPQLNLKTRYAESNYNMECVRNDGKRILSKHAMRSREAEGNHQPVCRNKNISPMNTQQYQENDNVEDNYDLAEMRRMRKHINSNNQQARDTQRENSIASGLYPVLATEEPPVTFETPLNKTQDTVSSDKTDKALCEIKDILQSFLLEIKKEASSHTEKCNGTRMCESGNSPPAHDAGVMTNHGRSFSNFNSAHCPVPPPYLPPTLPAFGNPCCYPIMPMCPINCNPCMQNSNCMQNRYPMPSASFTCNNCYDKPNEMCNSKQVNTCTAADEPLTSETDQLIKEIYKFVSQSPTFSRKDNASKGRSRSKKASPNDKLLTSRSVGGSTRYSRHDAKVGTAKMNCASKSCEAIGARLVSGVESSDTTASLSDTVLDKLSLEATHSTQNSETEISTEPSQVEKTRKSRLSKMLNSFGIHKKMKRDIIEELSESESTVDVEVKKKPPFRQNVTNYMMYGQEYYRPPPVPPCYPQDYRPPYNPDDPYRDPRMRHAPTHSHGSPHPHYHPEEYPTAPPYSQSYDSYSNPMQPQVPLCLKEVEVKSIGCQSERKISFFQKIAHKVQQPAERESTQGDFQRNGATQTAQNKPTSAPAPAPAPFFNWRNTSKTKDSNPMTFGYETQKKLALGDVKMRNAMLKKMFYKRNPFSPRNLIVRTLLGKDKSSYGDPPSMYRPKLFF